MVSSRRGVWVCLLSVLLCSAAALAQAGGVDPNRGPSEFNHHVAGFALVGVGLLVIAGRFSPRLRWLQLLWPFLFIFAGLFLATWSDAEIWPRGNLSWTWLIHHDPEARQHKVYALLLLAIGVIEYLRARGHLGRFWRTWSFPALAIFGAAFLLMHDHGGNSGVHTSNVHAYLVNPALDPDGKPWPTQGSTVQSPPREHSEHAMNGMDMAGMDSHQMDHGNMVGAEDDPPDDNAADPSDDSDTHSVMAASAPPPSSSGHHHQMTPAMLLVEREHFWFMIVGFAIALFKFISDGDFWRRRFVPYLWPSGMVLLGILLTLYHE
jgi:cell division protein FtsW (lipid II flippase)